MPYEYSTDGPVCPNCKVLFTPDENFFYDETAYELECFDCDTKFVVDACCVWSWITKIKENKNG